MIRGVLAGVAVTLLLVGVVIAIAYNQFRDKFTQLTTPQIETKVLQVDRESAEMTQKVQYAQQNVGFHIEGTEKRYIVLESHRLIIVQGFCEAGMDYQEHPPTYEPSLVNGVQRVQVLIPRPQILNCGTTSVAYFDGQGLLPASTALTNQLHEDAVKRLREEALNGNLLATADKNALAQIELQLRRLGFQEVQIRYYN